MTKRQKKKEKKKIMKVDIFTLLGSFVSDLHLVDFVSFPIGRAKVTGEATRG